MLVINVDLDKVNEDSVAAKITKWTCSDFVNVATKCNPRVRFYLLSNQSESIRKNSKLFIPFKMFLLLRIQTADLAKFSTVVYQCIHIIYCDSVIWNKSE